MDNAVMIAEALERVFELRRQAQADSALAHAVILVKRFQAQRFRTTYADLLVSSVYGPASRFFLEELYGDSDYTQRDAQFARIVGKVTAVLPESVSATTLVVAQVHALTEELDFAMALQCVGCTQVNHLLNAQTYTSAWHAVGRHADRQLQLRYVLEIGHQLLAFTRKRGLVTMLRLMRGPASAAGLASLQAFLENGFTIFAAMAHSKNTATQFMETIAQRETQWIATMFDDPSAPGE